MGVLLCAVDLSATEGVCVPGPLQGWIREQSGCVESPCGASLVAELDFAMWLGLGCPRIRSTRGSAVW